MSERKRIAVAGAGIAGLAAAWLLSRRHDVTLFEADNRLGGHSHTVVAGAVPVDTGFIVYNEPAYPNLTALFHYLGVATQASDMSFSVSWIPGGWNILAAISGDCSHSRVICSGLVSGPCCAVLHAFTVRRRQRCINSARRGWMIICKWRDLMPHFVKITSTR